MTDDTNIFCSDRNIKYLFQKPKINFKKFPSGFGQKTKYTIFHKLKNKASHSFS